MMTVICQFANKTSDHVLEFHQIFFAVSCFTVDLMLQLTFETGSLYPEILTDELLP